MKDIEFRITENDIQEYLKQHRNNENIKYKEAMFVKYMKERRMITKESLEILMEKYNFDDDSITGIYRYQDFKFIHQDLPNFNDYLDNIKNLDISGICHIMLPCIKYYDCETFKYNNILKEANNIAKLLGVNSCNEPENILFDTIENYTVAGVIKDFRIYRGYSTITMGKEKSRRMIQEYSYIYGQEPVKIIRKEIRERVK